MWMTLNGGLKTNELRARCGLSHSSLCPLCNDHTETDIHLLRDCTVSKQVWNLIGEGRQRNPDWSQSLTSWILANIHPSNGSWASVFGSISTTVQEPPPSPPSQANSSG